MSRWVGMWTGAAAVENSTEESQKATGGLTSWSGNPTTGHTPEKDKNIRVKRYMRPNAHGSVTTIEKKWKPPSVHS